MGDVGDQRLDDLPLPLQISGGGGGAIEKPGQLGLQRGGNGFVKGVFPKASVHSGGQHFIQPPEGPAAAVPLVQAEAQAQKGQCQTDIAARSHHWISQV